MHQVQLCTEVCCRLRIKRLQLAAFVITPKVLSSHPDQPFENSCRVTLVPLMRQQRPLLCTNPFASQNARKEACGAPCLPRP